jgi:hypothetical protein
MTGELTAFKKYFGCTEDANASNRHNLHFKNHIQVEPSVRKNVIIFQTIIWEYRRIP